MMAKFVLQLQVIVIVLTFFLIVIDHYVCGASEHVRVYRGDNDIFENPNHANCTARNAITFLDTNSGCSRCRCFGQYKTYLHSFDRCVRDNELSFLPVGNNSFMIQQSENEHICIHYDRSYGITTTKCNSSDPFQRWIWTQHSQLLHAETSKCIQQGKMFPGQMYTWHLGLEECNVSETKQRWDCDANFLVKRFLRTTSQQDTMYITYENDNDNTIVAKEQAPKNWKRYQLNSKICSSSFGCNEFTNPPSAMLILDTIYQQQGEQHIADLPKDKNCSVICDRLQFWDRYYWVHLDHECKENIFSISNTTTSGKLLKWNLTRTPSNWTNLIIKLNFKCSSVPEPMNSFTAETSTRCVLIKLTYPAAGCPATASTTVSSPETAPTKPPTPATSATSATSSHGNLDPSHLRSTKLPTSSKEQQEGGSSSVVGIVVGLLAAILVLCGIILGYFCYKRRKSRLDKTSSNVEINGKGKSSGDTMNPIYSSADNKNPSLSNDGGIYQEPDGNANAASQECDLYEPGGDHEYDYAKVEQKSKPAPPSEELEYDYAKTDDIKSAVQRAPVRGNAYQDTVIKNKNTATDANEDKETGNDAGPLYQTLEDETAPVYQTLESE